MPTPKSPVILKLSKVKLSLLTVGAWLFVAGCVWLWGAANSSPLVRAVSGLGLVFFSGCGLYGGRKIVDKRPGLVMDDVGIWDNASAVAAGLVKWENIEGYEVARVHGNGFLLIEVNNAPELIARQPLWKRTLMRANRAFYRTPVTLSSHALQCSFEQLVQLVARRMQEMGKV